MKALRIYLVFIFLLLINIPLKAAWEKVLDLSGKWAFTIGDRSEWASPSYDDSNWDQILVPGKWESQGFEAYDGFAWYRKTFSGDRLPQDRDIYLSLGEIDDADEVFVNGTLIGRSGSFPPHFSTAYQAKRQYLIPRELIRSGINLISVRVFDYHYEGGIIRGDIGLFQKEGLHKEFFDLEGIWKFKTSSDAKPCGEEEPDSWDRLMVPGIWEHQGYEHYNGFACYRKTFICPPDLTQSPMILTLGLIDDMDIVYLNGEKIGSTGIKEDGSIPDPGNSWAWKQLRGYFIPMGMLKPNQENVITIKVYDHIGEGGIYRGPVGIIPAKYFTSFFKNIALE